MKVRLKRNARIVHQVGEIVEVSPTEFLYLVSLGSAEPVEEAVETPEAKKATTRKKK